MTIRPKTESELDLMRESGRKLNDTLHEADNFIKPGKSLLEIDTFIFSVIQKLEATPSFKGYRGFPASSCLSVNAVVVHGIPTDYVLHDGDILGVDIGLFWEGYHTDAAFTKPIGVVSEQKSHLLRVTQESLKLGIEAAIAGNVVGDIGTIVENYVYSQGKFGIIRDLTGHGVGGNLQELPEIPNYANKNSTPLINNMTIAIEPMISLGTPDVRVLDDNWSVVTADDSPAAHFETTLIIADNDPEILVHFPLTFSC